MQNNVMSVKDLNQMVKDLLTDAVGQVWLLGEISNFSKPASGHWYFTLKDDVAQVRCAMFRNCNFRTGFIPQNGQQILVRATVTLYEARGEYQLVIDKLQVAGNGLLQQKFEQLKKQLQDEGLFESSHKKTLPDTVRVVGVITSSTGAALHDICQILKRRDPSLQVIIYPTLVQGNEAAPQIAKMIAIANQRNECDILIVGRGGGSLEDLWPFNEEVVARAIFASQLPIISAVGHEVDFTIADFVADLRAATPSAAAELVSKDKQERLNRLQNVQQHLLMVMDYLILQKREYASKLFHRLSQQHPQLRLARQQTLFIQLQNRASEFMQQKIVASQQRLHRDTTRLSYYSPQKRLNQHQVYFKGLQERLNYSAQTQINQIRHRIELLAEKLHSMSPLQTLSRGYSVTTRDQHEVITCDEQVKVGDTIVTQLQKGKIISHVTEIAESI
ncbi:exodeoxyribonuclease VII large subunit [Utexia brackfieldae]